MSVRDAEGRDALTENTALDSDEPGSAMPALSANERMEETQAARVGPDSGAANAGRDEDEFPALDARSRISQRGD